MSRMRSRREDVDGRETAELAALADGSLSPERRDELEARVATSPELAERLAEQQRAVAMAQSAAAEVEAPAALRARVEAERRTRRVRPPLGLALAGAAAITVLVVAIGFAVFHSNPSAERFQGALSGTTLAPNANGDVTLTKTSSGWRIELQATGLPRRQGRLFYEAWLRNAQGVLVPIGTFNDARNVTLWAGVSPKDFTLLTVTRERADGDQASSGEKVLVGRVYAGN
ncbi:MAG TPA: anti-sigma factor [Gaiellaceae bacterium]|nr:anti-sigma factor [Gaiellaceae bacterium]